MNAQRLTGDLLAKFVAMAIAGGIIFSGVFAADLDKLTASCASCHGEGGTSTESTIPTIGGMSEQFMIDTMDIYREEDRPCIEAEYLDGEKKGEKTDMCKIATELDDEDIEALAGFYASKPFVRAIQNFDTDKAKRGKRLHDTNCEKCHEDGGSSAEDDAGVLAGQWMPYLEQTFKSYGSGKRVMDKKMKPKMEKLSDADKEDLVHFYGSLQ